jgi:hypothetical protein
MKLKRMGVSVELLKVLLAQDNVMPSVKVVADGIPEDAVACGIFLEDGRQIWVTFQSDTFAEVKEGDEIPVFNPCFETVKP